MWDIQLIDFSLKMAQTGVESIFTAVMQCSFDELCQGNIGDEVKLETNIPEKNHKIKSVREVEFFFLLDFSETTQEFEIKMTIFTVRMH